VENRNAHFSGVSRRLFLLKLEFNGLFCAEWVRYAVDGRLDDGSSLVPMESGVAGFRFRLL
jgi:hypothetical protein